MYNHITIEKFENNSRIPILLDIVLKINRGIKSWYNKYMKARQAKADREVDFYFKDNADWERFQRNLDKTRNYALFYVRN